MPFDPVHFSFILGRIGYLAGVADAKGMTIHMSTTRTYGLVLSVSLFKNARDYPENGEPYTYFMVTAGDPCWFDQAMSGVEALEKALK